MILIVGLSASLRGPSTNEGIILHCGYCSGAGGNGAVSKAEKRLAIGMARSHQDIPPAPFRADQASLYTPLKFTPLYSDRALIWAWILSERSA